MRFRVAAVTTLVGLFAFSVAAQDRKLVIVIDTFEDPANYRNSTIGNALTDMFITSLSRTGTFTIMDTRGGTRDQVDADLYLSAKVTNFSYFEDEVAVATADRARSAESATVFEQTMSIRIDITAVDDSQEIIFAEMVEHTETNTSATAMATNYRQLVAASVSVNEMTNSMMGRATVPAIDRAVERVTTYFDILAISEFPKWRKYLISLSFRDKSSVRPVQVGGFEANIVVHRSTAVRGRGGPPPPWGVILSHTDGPCGS